MILTGIIHIYSIIAGCVMLLLAFIMCVLEATIICSGVSFAQPIIQRIDKIKNWHRGATYCGYVFILRLRRVFCGKFTDFLSDFRNLIKI